MLLGVSFGLEGLGRSSVVGHMLSTHEAPAPQRILITTVFKGVKNSSQAKTFQNCWVWTLQRSVLWMCFKRALSSNSPQPHLDPALCVTCPSMNSPSGRRPFWLTPQDRAEPGWQVWDGGLPPGPPRGPRPWGRGAVQSSPLSRAWIRRHVKPDPVDTFHSGRRKSCRARRPGQGYGQG